MGKKQLAVDYYTAPPFDVILDPLRLKGAWSKHFHREAPLHVEIGMGLGKHLLAMAQAKPDWNHVGLEMKMHRIYSARNMALRRGWGPLRFVHGDALKSLQGFAPGEVSHLTLLFSDPWPRPQDEAKRLTHPQRVALYREVLAPGGVLHFRSDDPPFFEYSCKVFESLGFSLKEAMDPNRVVTEFEARWMQEGKLIQGVDATRLA